MDFRHHTASLDKLSALKTDALVLVLGSEKPSSTLDPVLAALVHEAAAQGDFPFKANQSLYLHRPAGVKATRVVLVCAPGGLAKDFKKAVAHALRLLKDKGAELVSIALSSETEITSLHAQALVSATGNALYVYRHTKPSAPPPSKISTINLVCSKTQTKAVQEGLVLGQAIGAGVLLARECANRPANHATPTFLAEQAKKMGKQHGLKVEVLDKKAVEKLGMGAFLAVAQGSAEPLRFIVMHYQGAVKSVAPIVLVGKGITFDSGGISIKPALEMDEMKFDMGGAACVLGTMRAVAQLQPKLNVIGIIAACENMPDGQAIKPGDVVTSMSGTTIEILNTDAEGRLVLCDALTYAERFKPAMVVDIATLTGACVIALGHQRCGMFTDDEAMAGGLLAAGDVALDPCWRMPLDEEYDEALKSNFADVPNVGPRVGGAITAAMFLRRFTKKYRWAHLDVAGVAWKSGTAKGATGRPVALLTHFVMAQQQGK
jgi:leucyl aminopeptidase